MLRALVVLLVAANLLFFAWSRGWLSPALPAPHQGEREPERLAAQIKPETVRIQTPQAASAAAAAQACLEAGPFSDADVGIAEAALLGAGISASAWVRDQVQQPATWLVYMGRFADAASLKTKEDELKRLKLPYDEVKTPADLAPGIALSQSGSQAAAEASLLQLQDRGVHTARVVALPPPPLQHWLRAPQADPDLQARLHALNSQTLSSPFGPCQLRR